jgi:Ca2+-binding RTX toxin-like protein
MILGQLQPDGRIEVYDNIDRRNGVNHIGRHMADYDTKSVPASVTIYRLTTDDLYLIATTDHAETVLGTTFNDKILAAGGDDIVRGGIGNDILDGGAGNDTLDGGAGTDTAVYSSGTQRVVVDLPGRIALGTQIGTDTLSNIENVKTGSGNDAVAGSDATNVLDGGAGIDTVSYYKVSSGVVLDLAAQVGVDGTSRDTLLNFENANGTAYNDAISGTAAVNVLNGLGGTDTISYYRSAQAW